MSKSILCLLFVIFTVYPGGRLPGQSIQTVQPANQYNKGTKTHEASNYLSTRKESTRFDSISRANPEAIAIPLSSWSTSVLQREGFTIGYDRSKLQARWVAYMLLKRELNGPAKRASHFFCEPELVGCSAVDTDYKKSGYDRGHLAPAADMAWSERAMRESFSFANVSPQKPAFNRGIWKKLEEQVRTWTNKFDTVWIVTGPVFDSTAIQQLNKKIPIPGHFYKALLSHHQQQWEAIAFLMPNEASANPVQQYAISIRRLEEMTKIDFFHLLPDSVEHNIEPKCPVNFWFNN